MIVLLNCLSSVSGGAVSYMRNMAPLLSAQFREAGGGHRFRLLAHEEQKHLLQSVPDADCLWVRGKRPTGYWRVLWEYLNMPRILREMDIDVLFTPYQIAWEVTEPKHVMVIRNMEPFLCRSYRYSARSRWRNHLLRRASVKSLRNASRVIAVSQYARDYLVGQIGVEQNRVRTIYHGCSIGSPVAPGPQEDRELLKRIGVPRQYMLTCGSLLPYRRCEDAVAAFSICAETLDPEVRLVIAGTGTDPCYRRLIHRMIGASSHRDRILVLGHVPSNVMWALYRECLLCVIASEIEACPNIAIEAMASGCAIVSAKGPPLSEIFGGCSLEYGRRNVEELAAQIGRCVENGQLWRSMKTRAAKRAEAFSWERCARETYSALVDW